MHEGSSESGFSYVWWLTVFKVTAVALSQMISTLVVQKRPLAKPSRGARHRLSSLSQCSHLTRWPFGETVGDCAKRLWVTGGLPLSLFIAKGVCPLQKIKIKTSATPAQLWHGAFAGRWHHPSQGCNSAVPWDRLIRTIRLGYAQLDSYTS